MADSRFFQKIDTLTLRAIADIASVTIPAGVDGETVFSDVAPLQEAHAEHISFLDNTKYKDAFCASHAGACFVKDKFAHYAPEGMIALLCDDPYRAYAAVASSFYPAPKSASISDKAVISDQAVIGNHCQIDAGAVIGAGCQIGDYCRIGANSVITHSLIGDHVTIHPNCNIGQDGFGFAMSAKGHLKVPQLGRVLIEDDVEIGAGSCIDRGSGPDTIIGAGTKIDNMVQIAHNVKIGRGVVIVSQVGISGSTQIGDFCVLGGQVGVAGHITIGPGAQLAARTGVIASLEGGKTYGGTPALPIKDWHRQTLTLNDLAKKKRRNA